MGNAPLRALRGVVDRLLATTRLAGRTCDAVGRGPAPGSARIGASSSTLRADTARLSVLLGLGLADAGAGSAVAPARDSRCAASCSVREKRRLRADAGVATPLLLSDAKVPPVACVDTACACSCEAGAGSGDAGRSGEW